MHASRFHVGLIAVLATGLGFTVASSEAVGYPSSSVVSLGSNPIWGASGTLTGGSTAVLVSVPIDQDAVVTDVQLGMSDEDSGFNCMTKWVVKMQEGAETFGTWSMQQYRHYSDGDSWTPGVQHVDSSYTSGLRIPAGTSLTVGANKLFEMDCSGDEYVHYTVSGYYAQP